MENAELEKTLAAHELWLQSGGKSGRRADLSGQSLNGRNFEGHDLSKANFQGAELRLCNFSDAQLRQTNLREADLQNANLETANFLLTAQLAGADVAGARLPQAIAEFEGLKTIAEAVSNAQKLFLTMLGGCVYSWLTIATTKDVALITNSASSPLPVIGTAVPMVGFYLLAPVILLAIYFYFHLNMQRLWEALADLPAVFPDGRSLDKRADPWLLNGLISAHFSRLKNERPPLSHLQQWLSIVLAWWVVPFTLITYWGRFLPVHSWFGTGLQILFLVVVIGFGWISYRLARATLGGMPFRPFSWREALRDRSMFKSRVAFSGLCAVSVIFFVVSFGSIYGVPYDPKSHTKLSRYWDPQLLVPRLFSFIHFRPFADLIGADLSKLEEQRINLIGANLIAAKLSGAYLEQAMLRNAELESAHLERADLTSARLEGANLFQAHLAGALLSSAKLGSAKLWHTDFTGARLNRSVLSGAIVTEAVFKDANFYNAHLEGVDLRTAKGLTKSQISQAHKDPKTLLPENLPP